MFTYVPDKTTGKFLIKSHNDHIPDVPTVITIILISDCNLITDFFSSVTVTCYNYIYFVI